MAYWVAAQAVRVRRCAAKPNQGLKVEVFAVAGAVGTSFGFFWVDWPEMDFFKDVIKAMSSSIC